MPRALLDTNILIHREASIVKLPSIGRLFFWLDRLRYEKAIHPLSIEEIHRHQDSRLVESFRAKMESYRVIQVPAEMGPRVAAMSAEFDKSPNDHADTRLLNEVFAQRCDILISEDRGIAKKADLLSIGDRVFTVDGFLEKAVAENPDQIDYRVLTAKKTLCGRVDVSAEFFDQFRADYPGFDQWFNRKAEEPAYVCYEGANLVAFLYLKIETADEPYHDVSPPFAPRRRLKIGTMKVELNGFKLGERLLKIVFDNALRQRVDEIYVTIFPRTIEQERLTKLLEDFGFRLYGTKRTNAGDEGVYVREMTASYDLENPRSAYPLVSRRARSFLVPIYPQYHTELLPDSILSTESPEEFVESRPHRNAIRKVYVSRSIFRALRTGDVIVFYRTGGYYKSVLTTLGVVDGVHTDVRSLSEFVRLSRKRSVFSDAELRKHWEWGTNRPFVVEFLYSYSFPKRPNLKELIDHRVISDVKSAPRGFEEITPAQFQTVLRLTESDPRLVVD